ncbi:lipid A deacylase LpxR family protein [Parvularcula lutaonensis]|uniref:Lipid A deacylase LpxR family protein n=1 Tax=Parvularcula lutaonensis TaxID=491923 RepID=A0ABV7MCJ1_9PROT|nr:lipid A deacylase LpxR family protein [Parvularcula lutaonensis]GGY49138.1 membrane protein [Parvularcula lutaonensis]
MLRRVHIRIASVLAGIACAALLSAAFAEETKEPGTLTFTVENDVVSGQDRHYTNGLRIAYVTAPVTPNALERMLSKDGDTVRRSFSLSQQIYTPEDLFTDTPDPDDHPYNGYLFGEASVLTERDGRWDLYTLEVGVVGEGALGEETQNWFHRTFDFWEAEGWDTQMDTEATVNVSYDWKGRPWAEGKIGSLDAEFTPVAGFSAGTVAINARAGGMVRIGPELVPNFGPARIRPSLTGSGHFSKGGSWFVFAGVQGRAVAHDLFLEGSFFQDSATVEAETFVADFQGGIVAEVGKAQLSWTYIARTKRYATQDNGGDQFGAFSVGFKL